MVLLCIFLELRDVKHFSYSFPYIVYKLTPYQVHGVGTFPQLLDGLYCVLFALQRHFGLRTLLAVFVAHGFRALSKTSLPKPVSWSFIPVSSQECVVSSLINILKFYFIYCF